MHCKVVWHTTNLITLHNASDEDAINNGCHPQNEPSPIIGLTAVFSYRCSINQYQVTNYKSCYSKTIKKVTASLKGQFIGNPQSGIRVNKTNKVLVCRLRKKSMAACQLYPITTHTISPNTSAAGKDQQPSEHWSQAIPQSRLQTNPLR